jgi:hypothetical protein
MARVALLIGTENYGTEFGRLEATPRNVHALAAVLENPLMGGFDSVEKLIDPDHSKMGETIETWLRSRDKKDLILLYIAGHGIKDVARQLYFTASTSRKVEGELVTSTAVSAQNVQGWLRTSAKRQIVILDCCFSGAFGDLLAQDDGSVDVEAALGAEGRVVLTSSSSMQYSFQQREGELSVYTHHLIEGIRTGAADLDDDGKISTDELHEYTCRKVQEESHGMHPKIIVTKDEGYRLKVANTPLNDPLVKYRKEVEKIVAEDENEICEVFSRPYLEELHQKLEISSEIAQSIEDSVLEPIHQYQSKLQKYRSVIDEAVKKGMYPFGDRETKRLEQLKNTLGLAETDVIRVFADVLQNYKDNADSVNFVPNTSIEIPNWNIEKPLSKEVNSTSIEAFDWGINDSIEVPNWNADSVNFVPNTSIEIPNWNIEKPLSKEVNSTSIEAFDWGINDSIEVPNWNINSSDDCSKKKSNQVELSSTANCIALYRYNTTEALVRWVVDHNVIEFQKSKKGSQLILDLYDVTEMEEPTTFLRFDLDVSIYEQRIKIPQNYRAYMGKLLYLTDSCKVTEIARSEVKILGGSFSGDVTFVVLAHYSARTALICWDIDRDDFREELLREKTQLVLRLYDVTTNPGPSTFFQFDLDESIHEQQIIIPKRNCVYTAALGFLMHSGSFLEMTQSKPSRF